MHIRKQRLLTPGPTPLYPKALHAMMDADIHHRTEDFRNLYKTVLADLKTVLGTQNEVLVLVASGTGAMEASVTNCFSPGDKAIVCTAGKFGERWVEIVKAYGAGDLKGAAEAQRKFSLFPSRWIQYGLAPVMKAAMRLAGVDVGDPHPPFEALPPEEARSLESHLKAIGLIP